MPPGTAARRAGGAVGLVRWQAARSPPLRTLSESLSALSDEGAWYEFLHRVELPVEPSWRRKSMGGSPRPSPQQSSLGQLRRPSRSFPSRGGFPPNPLLPPLEGNAPSGRAERHSRRPGLDNRGRGSGQHQVQLAGAASDGSGRNSHQEHYPFSSNLGRMPPGRPKWGTASSWSSPTGATNTPRRGE